MMVLIKNKEQIQNIQIAGNIIAQIFVVLQDYLEEGMNTYNIDRYIHELIVKEGGTPSFLGYNGYAAATCISINEQIIHGTPSEKNTIKNGDIVSIDIGVTYQGNIADSAYSFYLGDNPPSDVQRLLSKTKEALDAGIKAVKPENRITDISKAIQQVAAAANLGIIREYCGHGVGVELHEAPEIPNYYPSFSSNARLKEGMVLAIEPMCTLGKEQIVLLDDNFTVASKDASLAAHFEHTVLVTNTGYKILTK